jgi:hypothetical protein
MFLRWKTKKLNSWVKIIFLRCDVTKWRHNVKLAVDFESTNQGLLYEVIHGMVPMISKFWPCCKQILTSCETYEGQGWSAQKNNQQSGRPYATLTPCLELIWLQLLKNKGFVDTILWHDLDLWPWPSNGAINVLTAIEGQLHKRCYVDVRLVEWGNFLNSNDYITKKWTMSPIGLTVSCKCPPHIWASIDLGPPFGHALTHVPHSSMHWLRGEQVDFVSFFYPMRIQVRIGPPHPHACRKRRLNGVVLRMKPEKPRPRVTVVVAR